MLCRSSKSKRVFDTTVMSACSSATSEAEKPGDDPVLRVHDTTAYSGDKAHLGVLERVRQDGAQMNGRSELAVPKTSSMPSIGSGVSATSETCAPTAEPARSTARGADQPYPAEPKYWGRDVGL